MAVGSKVIKSDNPLPDPALDRQSVRPARQGGVIRSEQFEAQESEREILTDAQRKAEQILAEANRQKAKVFEEAKEAGRQEGLALVTEQLAKAKVHAGELLAQHEQDVIALACKIAEKIIGRDIQRDSQALVEMCATALENVRSAKAVVLRMNPRVAIRLREHQKELMALIGRTVDVAIKEDGDVADGDCCIIQTEFGTIDARLSTQLEIIRSILLDEGMKKDGPA